MTPRQRLQVALEIAVRRLERRATLGQIVGDLQDAICGVSCELISTDTTTEHEGEYQAA